MNLWPQLTLARREEPAEGQGVGVCGYSGQVVLALQGRCDELLGDDERDGLGQEQQTNDD